MISSERFRPSLNITIADIFQDFNHPRKQQLAKRVALALQDQQNRLKSQLDSNNLSNLQLLLRKQQTLKSLEDKISQKDQQIQQIKQLNSALTLKIDELQKQMLKKTQITNHKQQKIKNLTGSLKNLQSVIKSRQTLEETLVRQKQKLTKQNQQLQTEKQKCHNIITNLRQSYNKKMEETQYVLKIKQKQMTEQFNQNLSQIVTKNAQEKQRKEVDKILKPARAQTKTQRIQCELIHAHTQSSPRKKHDIKTQESAAQTDQNEGKLITQIIVRNQKIKQYHQNLQEVRLMYTKTPMLHQPNKKAATPRVTTYTNVFTQQKQIQTEVQPKKNTSQSIQVSLKVEDKQLRQQIEQYKQKLAASKQFHQHRYAQLKHNYQHNKQQISKIQHYKLQIMELKLQIQKAEHESAKEREILTNINEKLQLQQNQLMLRKFSSKLQPHSRNNNSKTCSLFYPKPKRIDRRSQITVSHTSQNHNPERKVSISRKDSDNNILSPRKWQQQQTDIITVIKHSNKLKYFSQKRRSVTEQISNPLNTSNLISKRGYQKYSNLKRS